MYYTKEDMITSMATNKICVYLIQVSQQVLEFFNLIVGENLVKENLVLSRPIGMISNGHVMSKMTPVSFSFLRFFQSFDHWIWLSILLSLLFISFFYNILNRKHSLKLFLLNLWKFSFVILSEPIPYIFMPKHTAKRLIVISWLLACTVLLSAFAGVLRRFFIQSVSYDIIDSWDKLYINKDINIYALQVSTINQLIESNQNIDEMAKDFSKRLTLISWDNKINESNMYNYYRNISMGKYVFTDTIFQLLTVNKLAKSFGFNNLHISEYGSVIYPYFLLININCGTKLVVDINTV
jgi:hypothetical protein